MKAEFVIYAIVRRGDSLEFAGRCRDRVIRVGDEFTWAYCYRQPGNRKGKRHKEVEVSIFVEAIVFHDWAGEEVTLRYEQQVLPEQAARLLLTGKTLDLLGERDVLGYFKHCL